MVSHVYELFKLPTYQLSLNNNLLLVTNKYSLDRHFQAHNLFANTQCFSE